MAIYCDKCGASRDCSVCPVCHGLGKLATAITDELRAKFEEWWEENYFYVHEKLASLKEYAWMGWQAAHASRDAEVEALKRDAERYRALEKLAQKQTAYDRYGNGAYWTIGLFSDDSRMTFVETIDAAMAK